VPTDPLQFNWRFYQDTYSDGITTECPDIETLSAMKRSHFKGTEKDFTKWIELLTLLGVTPGQRVLDFGASWGYGTWQLSEAGFQVTGFEVSERRARYAREIVGLDVVDAPEDVRGLFDIVFACHVLEHVPRPSEVVQWLSKFLKPGGLLIAITPNGSGEYLQMDPLGYHRRWGLVHPYYLDAEFYSRAFQGRPTLLASCPYDLTSLPWWDRRRDWRGDLSGWELLCCTVF
jgi:2-polyprenyl-3-methyl-5-hydroxy-6-metoxy-1,4-benzoquinol methylase